MLIYVFVLYIGIAFAQNIAKPAIKVQPKVEDRLGNSIKGKLIKRIEDFFDQPPLILYALQLPNSTNTTSLVINDSNLVQHLAPGTEVRVPGERTEEGSWFVNNIIRPLFQDDGQNAGRGGVSGLGIVSFISKIVNVGRSIWNGLFGDDNKGLHVLHKREMITQVSGERSLLVLTINFNTKKLTYNNDNAAQWIFGGTGTDNVDKLYRECTQSQISFPKTKAKIMGPYSIADPPNYQDTNVWLDWVKAQVETAVKADVDTTKFDHMIMILPSFKQSDMGATGLANVGPDCAPCPVWINTGSRGFANNPINTIAHELGHNLGWGHAGIPATGGKNIAAPRSTIEAEYGDWSSTMGNGLPICPNFPHQITQNWIKSSYTIGATLKGARISPIGIVPTVSSVAQGLILATLPNPTYISYRASTGADARFSAIDSQGRGSWSNAVYIHEVNGGQTTAIAKISIGDSFTKDLYTVTFQSMDGINAVVNVDITDKNDCASKPCGDNGWCSEQIGGYNCICNKGYVGAKCQSPVCYRFNVLGFTGGNEHLNGLWDRVDDYASKVSYKKRGGNQLLYFAPPDKWIFGTAVGSQAFFAFADSKVDSPDFVPTWKTYDTTYTTTFTCQSTSPPPPTVICARVRGSGFSTQTYYNALFNRAEDVNGRPHYYAASTNQHLFWTGSFWLAGPDQKQNLGGANAQEDVAVPQYLSSWDEYTASGWGKSTGRFDGVDCPSAIENSVDCVGSWSTWSQCSSACGDAFQSRKYTITQQSEGGGIVCPAADEQQELRNCDLPPCACPGNWQTWGQCSATCGGGVRTRSYSNPSITNTPGCPTNGDTQQEPCNTNSCPTPVDCQGDWSPWSTCTATCGTGTTTRKYTVSLSASNGGKACPAQDQSTQQNTCNTNACPAKVDCVGVWTDWSKCSISCGGGTQSRSYSVSVPAANGGQPCPYTTSTESRSCNVSPCPVDCVGSFTVFSECSATCGGGRRSRSYQISKSASGGGVDCPYTSGYVDQQPCNTQACPVDCKGSWSSYAPCTVTCGTGTETRVFTITQPAMNGGQSCGIENGAKDTRECIKSVCPVVVDCAGSWSAWSSCSTSCGGGSQSRTFAISTPSANGGKDCTDKAGAVQTQTCNIQSCPVNCQGSFSDFGPCSAQCGPGVQKRTYTISKPSAFGGSACPYANNYQEEQPCNLKPCPPPVNCQGHWSTWTDCSKQCGGGSQTRSYIIDTQAANGGASCAQANGESQTQTCNTNPCPVDCKGQWGSWSTCSKSCGSGTQKRAYTISQSAANGGLACPTTLEEQTTCNTQPCPVDCSGTFSGWSQCSAQCGPGVQKRTYTITQASANGGASCPYSNNYQEEKQCNDKPCPPPTNCQGRWNVWSDCTKSCGSGTQTRTYVVDTPASNGGVDCTQKQGDSQTQNCNTNECPVDCQYKWSDWSQCSASCGSGIKKRSYSVTVPARNNGMPCPSTVEEQVQCNTQACPVDCQGAFTDWGDCSAKCGGGIQYRTYIITQQAANGGKVCPFPHLRQEQQQCNPQACLVPVDCQGRWNLWSDCSKSCGGGLQTRLYVIDQPAANGGVECKTANGESQSQACNIQSCPVDCKGTWSQYSTCTQTCNGGIQKRTYTVTQPASNGGLACPVVQEEQVTCNTQPCPVACQGAWSDWSQCTAQCGPGIQVRTYSVITPSSNGGAACPTTSGAQEKKDCNLKACPVAVDCQGHWNPWGQCDKSCGGGSQSRTYTVDTPASNGGKDCTQKTGDSQKQPCNIQACPVNCQGQWLQWSACTQTCGGGTQKRTYSITVQPSNGGQACPTIQEEQTTCNTQPCPVACKGSFSDWSACSVQCGTGVQVRTYSISVDASSGGAVCPYPNGHQESQSCSLKPCAPAVDCQGYWTAWSDCSKTCSGGSQSRSYIITRQSSDGGASCINKNGDREEVSCNTQACPVDCKVQWSDWSACTSKCGGGVQKRSYTVLQQAVNGGAPCPKSQEEQVVCNTQPCPIDCQGVWSDWGACSAQCGPGTQKRTYKITQDSAFQGASCPFPNGRQEERACNIQPCAQAVNCQGHWNGWSSCSLTCGGGIQTRSYEVDTPASNGGVDCPQKTGDSQNQPCNTQGCPVNCVGQWQRTPCTKSCGSGTQTKRYAITQQPMNGGLSCPMIPDEDVPCNTQPCPINCQGAFSDWSSCSAQCGPGVQTRRYTISQQAANRGTTCPYADGHQEQRDCNLNSCSAAINCQGHWTGWGDCTTTCGGGVQTRTYVIDTDASNGGSQCPQANGQQQTQPCNTQPCPVDCKLIWSDWSPCSVSCGSGIQKRTYTITQQPQNNGVLCPSSTEEQRACNQGQCPVAVNCQGTWSQFTPCTKTCGTGATQRTYIVTIPASNGGAPCIAENGFIQNRRCNPSPCPINCIGSWTEFGACSATCGSGVQSRSFIVSQEANYSGTPCVASNGQIEQRACTLSDCPADIDCAGVWSAWSGCSTSCGAGTQTRTYAITKPAAVGGKACPATNGQKETRDCSFQPCPAVDCVGSWSDYSPCSKSCESGQRSRTFTVVRSNSNGGKACEVASGYIEVSSCNVFPCPSAPPVDCKGVWTEWVCDVKCGVGTERRTYSVIVPEKGGVPCPKPNGFVDTRQCLLAPCSNSANIPLDSANPPSWSKTNNFVFPSCTSLAVTGSQGAAPLNGIFVKMGIENKKNSYQTRDGSLKLTWLSGKWAFLVNNKDNEPVALGESNNEPTSVYPWSEKNTKGDWVISHNMRVNCISSKGKLDSSTNIEAPIMAKWASGTLVSVGCILFLAAIALVVSRRRRTNTSSNYNILLP